MKFLTVAIMLVVALFFAGDAQALSINNFGFETGDLTGWASNGNSAAVTAHSGDSTAYAPKVGNYFAKIIAGDAGYSYTLSQPFSISNGETISGWAAFDYGDYHSFDDAAYVQVLDQAGGLVSTPWFVNGNSVPDYWDGPWTPWSWTTQQGGNYQLKYGVYNQGDGSMPSYGLFDAGVVNGVVPEPTSMMLLGAGLAGLAGLRRKV